MYAYRFSTEESKKHGLNGKYILMQKIENREDCDNVWFSRIYIYDKIFDEMPKSKDITNLRILPMDVPERAEEYKYVLPINMSAVMSFLKKSEYPKDRLTYLGNEEIRTIVPYYNCRSDYYWYTIERCLISFYRKWQGVNYKIENGAYYTDDV